MTLLTREVQIGLIRGSMATIGDLVAQTHGSRGSDPDGYRTNSLKL
jgi:hydroxyethylthiazole kinase-like sugar kinase family protein